MRRTKLFASSYGSLSSNIMIYYTIPLASGIFIKISGSLWLVRMKVSLLLLLLLILGEWCLLVRLTLDLLGLGDNWWA